MRERNNQRRKSRLQTAASYASLWAQPVRFALLQLAQELCKCVNVGRELAASPSRTSAQQCVQR